jgi:hypothetical protein
MTCQGHSYSESDTRSFSYYRDVPKSVRGNVAPKTIKVFANKEDQVGPIHKNEHTNAIAELTFIEGLIPERIKKKKGVKYLGRFPNWHRYYRLDGEVVAVYGMTLEYTLKLEGKCLPRHIHFPLIQFLRYKDS